jgi:hypothetical protein
MRGEPSHTSEMVSQVLFGEEFQVLETRNDWHLISLDFDAYRGWVCTSSVRPAGRQNKAGIKPEKGFRMVSFPSITVVDRKTARKMILPAGSILPGTSGRTVKLYDREFELLSEEGIIVPGPLLDPEPVGEELCSVPYLWGGRSGFGFDCSGLTQTICRMMGVPLPRDAFQQSALGTTINFIHETVKGDLAFFENAAGEIAHVGMLLGGGRILHAYTSVRIDRIDHQGIYDGEKKTYTHKLRVIRRIAI